MTDKNETAQSKKILLITIVTITALTGCYFLIPSFQTFLNEAYRVLTSNDNERISAWVQQFGFWGPLFIMFAMTAQMFLFVFNVTLLVLVSILAYGSFWGSLIAILSICIASTIGFFIGKSLGVHTVNRLIGQSTERKIEHFMNHYGMGAVAIARVSPFLSNDAISFVAGILEMNYFKFMGATLVGITPLVVLIAWMSENMARLKNGLIWISVLSLAGFIIYVLYDKYLKKKDKKTP